MILNIISNFLTTKVSIIRSKTKIFPIGRWTIVQEHKIVEKRIHQANEDHCGCCNEKLEPAIDVKENEYYKYFLG